MPIFFFFFVKNKDNHLPDESNVNNLKHKLSVVSGKHMYY